MAKTELDPDDIVDAIEALTGALNILKTVARDLDIDLSELDLEDDD